MTEKFSVGMLLVSAGLVMSGCELGSNVSEHTTTVASTVAADALATNAATTDAATANAFALVETTKWPAYYAPKYFQHGTSDEEAYRSAAIAAASAQGLDCISLDCPSPPGDELAMHLMHFESPVVPGYFLGEENWYNRAMVRGIGRYIFNIGNANSATIARWLYLTKAYPSGSVQWILDGHVISALPGISP